MHTRQAVTKSRSKLVCKYLLRCTSEPAQLHRLLNTRVNLCTISPSAVNCKVLF